MPKHCLRKLYYAFVYPHIMYGIEIYANTCYSALDKLCKLNNKLLRILLNATIETPVLELYKSFDLLAIPVLFEFKLLVFVFDCLYRRQYSPEIFHNYFQVNSDFHDHNTRQRSNLHFESVQSSSGQRQTSFCASKFWNSLPQPLKNYTCRNSFKKALKQYLLNRE